LLGSANADAQKASATAALTHRNDQLHKPDGFVTVDISEVSDLSHD
jgi:hypothetical protein